MLLTQLLSNVAATGAWMQISRGEYAFSAYGTFGGATLTLQRLLPDGVTGLAIGPDAILTAPGQCLADLPGGQYRVLVAGGTPSALYAQLQPAGQP